MRHDFMSLSRPNRIRVSSKLDNLLRSFADWKRNNVRLRLCSTRGVICWHADSKGISQYPGNDIAVKEI